MDRSKVQQVRQDLEQALQTLGTKYGMAFSVGTIRFDASTIRCKLNGVTTATGAAPAITQSVEMVRLLNYIKGPWIPSELKTLDVNSKYIVPNLGYVQVVGYSPRRHKYPFTVKCIGGRGKQYKISLNSMEFAVRNGAK